MTTIEAATKNNKQQKGEEKMTELNILGELIL